MLPTLQSAVLFDFHAVTLAPTFLLFAFLALEQKNDRRFIVFVLLVMACKEDMPLVVAMLGVYAGLAQRRWPLAGLTLALSITWFALAFFVIQPHFVAGGNIQLDRYAWLGDTPWEMLQTMITQPDLVFEHVWSRADLPNYLATLFFPTAYLVLFSPLTLLPMLPSLAVNLLSDNPFMWRLEDFHYGAPPAPFLFISTIYGIRHIVHWTSRQPARKSPLLPRSSAPLLIMLLTVLFFLFSIVYHYHRGFTPLARPFIWPQVTAHHRQLEMLLATVPADIPLFTQSNLAPHLTHRTTLYTDFGYFTNPKFAAPETANDIVLDITTFENIGGLHQFLRSTLLESGNYRLVTAQDGILHFQLTAADHRPPTADSPSPPNLQSPISNLPPPFYSFTQPDTPPEYPLPVDFGDALRLHGYSLHFNRQEEIQVTVDLELLQPGDTLQPILYLLDAEGRPVGATTDLQPTLVWFPVKQWPVGKTIRIRFNTLPWYTREAPVYRLALGAASGSDVWDVGSRYRPVITSPTDFATRIPANGTLIELAYIEQKWNIPQGSPQQRQFAQPALPNNIRANFDNQIKLLGYTTPQISNLQSPNLSITLAWQAITPPEPLTRFAQLIGPDGQVYGQQDSAPDFGNYPTSLWQPGEVVVESVTFPLQAQRPTGDYTLHIGLYRPATGERLLLHSGGDHVEIAMPD